MDTPQDEQKGRLNPKHDKDDKLVEPQHKIRSVQVMDLYSFYAFIIFITIGTLSSITCSLTGKPFKEAGVLLNVGFWGGFGLAFLFMLKIMISFSIESWKLEKLNDEVEKERNSRGYDEPSSNVRIASTRELYRNCIRTCRRALGLTVPPESNAIDFAKKIKGDHLLELQHKLKNWQFPSPLYRYTGQLFIAVGSLSSIIRWHKDWSYEEVGLWFHLCLFGGYLMGTASMAASLWLSYKSQQNFDATLREFKEERTRRGLDPKPSGGNVETYNMDTC